MSGVDPNTKLQSKALLQAQRSLVKSESMNLTGKPESPPEMSSPARESWGETGGCQSHQCKKNRGLETTESLVKQWEDGLERVQINSAKKNAKIQTAQTKLQNLRHNPTNSPFSLLCSFHFEM